MMNLRSLGLLAVMIAVHGCSGKTETETGPTIRVTLANGRSKASDGDSRASLSNDKKPYVITVSVETTPGSGSADVPATSVSGVFSFPGTTIPESDFDTTSSGARRTFTRRDPITLPLTAKGQSLNVHVEAMDSRGLGSNILDFNVALE